MAKISLKKGILDVVLYIIVFIVAQLVVLYAGAGIWAAVKHEGFQATLQAMKAGGNPALLAITTVFSSIITLVVFLKAKWVVLTRDYLLSKPWFTLLWVALFTLGAIIPLEFL